MKTKHLLACAVVASPLFFAGAASASSVLTFDPSKTNVGCLDLNGGACGAAGTKGAFNTDNAIINYSGVLDIYTKAAPNAGIFLPDVPTPSLWAESGNILIENFKLGNVVQDSGVWRGATPQGQYDVYAKFTAAGNGAWLSAGNFVVGTISALTITLYMSPQGGTPQVLGTASSGVDVTGGIQGFGNEDFLLGIANIIAGPNQASASIFGNGTATTSLNALLDFAPNGGTTAPGGFFVAPDPFAITIGSQAGGNANNTTWEAFGDGVRITTANENRGGGSLAFTAQRVPEPSALALVGLALVGLGLSRRRIAAKFRV